MIASLSRADFAWTGYSPADFSCVLGAEDTWLTVPGYSCIRASFGCCQGPISWIRRAYSSVGDSQHLPHLPDTAYSLQNAVLISAPTTKPCIKVTPRFAACWQERRAFSWDYFSARLICCVEHMWQNQYACEYLYGGRHSCSTQFRELAR